MATHTRRRTSAKTETQDKTAAKPPVAQETFGRVKCVIWGNDTQSSGTMYSVQFSRLYKPENNPNWQESNSFNEGNDLLALAEAARWAYHEIRFLKNGDAGE